MGAEREDNMKILKKVLIALLVLILVFVGVFAAIYFTRLKTVASIEKVSDYSSGYDLYRMDIEYDYSIDAIIDYGITDTQSFIDAVLDEALPFLPVHIEVPDFGCSTFSVQDIEGDFLMGRNYDFSKNTSAMLVYCTPKDGYKSVGFAALDNISANAADSSLKTKLACLTAPFVCLDGINEKGVSIAVLTLDSDPTLQRTGKQVIATTLAIRLVLDRAATTEEAIQLLSGYDMLAVSGRDYHFYISDASGDGRVLEYDCEDETRPLVATSTRSLTNFFIMYEEQVLPNQHNGIYGHGRERYDAIEEILTENEGAYSTEIAWTALKAAAQAPKEGDVTSNTQWSIIFNNTDLTADMSLRRDWDTVFSYDLTTNSLTVEEAE